jgi:hypothetical protein
MSEDCLMADQVQNHFSFLFSDYDYKIWDKNNSSETANDVGVTLYSGDIYVDIFRDWRDDFVSILFRYKNDRRNHIDLGEVFRFLTNDLEWFMPGRPYYVPRPFNNGEENIVGWQLKRLAELTQPMWPKIEKTVTPKSKLNTEFREFKGKRTKFYAENEHEIWDTYKLVAKFVPKDRGELKFKEAVRESFGFLVDELDFVLTQPSVLFSRFESKSSPVIYVNVFHTKNMFRLGIHTAIKHDPDIFEKDYSLDELSRLLGKSLDPWPLFSKDHLSVSKNVAILADHFNLLCLAVIEHDISVFERLEAQRINYAYEVVEKWLEQEKHNPRST